MTGDKWKTTGHVLWHQISTETEILAFRLATLTPPLVCWCLPPGNLAYEPRSRIYGPERSALVPLSYLTGPSPGLYSPWWYLEAILGMFCLPGLDVCGVSPPFWSL